MQSFNGLKDRKMELDFVRSGRSNHGSMYGNMSMVFLTISIPIESLGMEVAAPTLVLPAMIELKPRYIQ